MQSTRGLALYNRPVTGFVLAALLSIAGQTPTEGPVIPKAPDAEAVLAQAVQLHEAGDFFGAITNYEAYLKVQPNNAGVHSNLGAAYVRLGRVADGIAEYRKALALDSASATFRFNLALALYTGRPVHRRGDRAADHRSAVRPATSAARLLLGDCYLRQGRFQDVIDLLAPWEASYGNDRGFAYVLGSAFIETDRSGPRAAPDRDHLQGRRQRRRPPARWARCTCAPATPRRR